MIKELSIEEITNIYQQYMVLDFPESELKPCKMIVDSIKQNKSTALGYYVENELKGYATVLIANNNLLLDYFAILSPFRQFGFGTSFMNELSSYLSNYNFLLIEAEAPTTIEAKKRIHFYTKCGCKDSNMKGYLYFVDYSLLYKELSKKYSIDEIQKEIIEIYQLVYPNLINTKYLQFHK